MIVECGSCQTRFQLDPSRIPRRGIRVRCSSCKTAFFLPHPDATPAEAADDVAKEAVEEAAASPPPTRDLDSEPDAYDSEPDDSADVEVDVDVGLEDEEQEEEDWEFNHAPEEPEPEPEPAYHGESEEERGVAPDSPFEVASEAAADSAGYAGDDSAPGLGDDPDSSAASETSSDSDDATTGEADSELGLASDWSEQAASPESGVGLELSADEEGLSIDLGDDGSSARPDGEFGEAADFSASPASPASPAPASSEDVSAGDPATTPEPALASAEPGEAGLFGVADQDLRNEAGAVEAGTSAGEDEAGFDAAEQPADVASDSEEEPVPNEAKVERLPASAGPGMSSTAAGRAPSRALAHLQKAVGAVGWGITLSLLGVGLVWGLGRAPSTSAVGPERVVLGDFYVDSVRSGWLDTARAGVVYTVSGRLVNATRASQPPESYLQVALVGSAGARLDVPAAIAGAPLPPGYLRELAVEDLRAVSAGAAARLARAPLAPGSGSDFLAYFVDLPPEAEGFVLEMASRPRGAQDPPGVPEEAPTAPTQVEPMDPAAL